MKRWRRLSLEALIVVAVVGLIGLWRGRAHPRGPVPDLMLGRLDGDPVSLRVATNGERTLVAFFAPWCGVCKVTAQNTRWASSVGGVRVVNIASSYGEDRAGVRAYAADHELPGAVLLDDHGAAMRAFHVTAFPTFFFVDDSGRITGSTVGYTTTLGLLARLW